MSIENYKKARDELTLRDIDSEDNNSEDDSEDSEDTEDLSKEFTQ